MCSSDLLDNFMRLEVHHVEAVEIGNLYEHATGRAVRSLLERDGSHAVIHGQLPGDLQRVRVQAPIPLDDVQRVTANFELSSELFAELTR